MPTETTIKINKIMAIEYEATFLDINKEETRENLKKVGAELVRPEFMQKRVVFGLPKDREVVKTHRQAD